MTEDQWLYVVVFYLSSSGLAYSSLRSKGAYPQRKLHQEKWIEQLEQLPIPREF